MRADFSRLIKDFKKHYAGVLHQQGRVWLDSDWNEDVLTRLFLGQQQTKDIIGSCGTVESENGFEIIPQGSVFDFGIHAGRYYVNGILAELNEQEVNPESLWTYKTQPDLLDPPDLPVPDGENPLYGVVYLEVWRRLVTYLDDSSIREIALGGPDTAVRLKTVAQIKVAPIPSDKKPENCEGALGFVRGPGLGTLTTVQPSPSLSPTVEPCRLPEEVNYTGRENRLYRVEIHDEGDVISATNFVSSIPIAEDANIGDKKIKMTRLLTEKEQLAISNSGVVTFTDNSGLNENMHFDTFENGGQTVTLVEGVTKKLRTDARASLKTTVPCVRLEKDALKGAIKLELAGPLDGPKPSGIVILSNNLRLGQTESVRYSDLSPDGKTLTLASPLRNDYSKDNKSIVTLGIASFKWSRDNGAFAVAVEKVEVADRKTLTLASLGRDQASILRAGDIVEITDDASELGPCRGHLSTLEKDPDPDLLTVSLSDPIADRFKLSDGKSDRHLTLRRWDGFGIASNNIDSPDLNLGDGIRLQFGGADLRSGDFWLITARSSDGVLEELKDAPADGIQRSCCPLALMKWEMRVDKETLMKVLDENTILKNQVELLDSLLAIVPNEPKLPLEGILDLAKKSGATQQTIDELKSFLSAKVEGAEFVPPLTKVVTRKLLVERALTEQLTNAEKELNKDGETSITTILKIAGDSGATDAKKEELRQFAKKQIENRAWVQVSRMHDCRKEFTPLTDLASGTQLTYLGGDGQESKPDGSLVESLRVAVYKGSKALSNASVLFTTKDGGLLNGAAASSQLKTDNNGVATCTWALATVPKDGEDFPSRTQLVEALLVDNPNDAPPIRFNACLGTYQFCYVGGDGQEAGDDDQLPQPLEVSVFDSHQPIKDAKVQFTIMDDHDGILAAENSESVDGTKSIIVPTNAQGIASCSWKLELKDLGKTQTVEARLLDANEKKVLQPVHFHAKIERDDGIAIKEIIYFEKGQQRRDLMNDKAIRPSDLIQGIHIQLNKELEDLQVVSRATCYVTVEAPISFFGDQLPESSAFVPIVLAGDVNFVGKKFIQWTPTAPTLALLSRWEDQAGERLLARMNILGNFIWSKNANLYLDGDTFGSDSSSSAIGLPTGDGRRGGEFRMWFWLQRKTIDTDRAPIDFGAVTTDAAGLKKKLTISSKEKQTISLKIVQDPAGPFSVSPVELNMEADEQKAIQIKFAPKTVAEFNATLKIQSDKSMDPIEVTINGKGAQPV